MRYLLDTNMVSVFYDRTNRQHENIFNRIKNLNHSDNLYISVLTLFEFEYSFSCCSDEGKRTSIRNTINKIRTIFNKIEISDNEAKIFGEIKALIKKSTGTTPNNMQKYNIDIMIGSSAISNSCVVVSGDKIFERISQLYRPFNFENWLKD
ncbi:MAG: type II toxin-antitoxin system VapC family toxin [Magnetococcus sp. THC-1_WYH]